MNTYSFHEVRFTWWGKSLCCKICFHKKNDGFKRWTNTPPRIMGKYHYDVSLSIRQLSTPNGH